MKRRDVQAIPASSSGYKDDKQIVRVAEAESIGIRVPNIDAAKIQRGARIGKGGEGVVYRGTLEGVGDVALKCLPLAGSTEQDQAQVRRPARQQRCTGRTEWVAATRRGLPSRCGNPGVPLA